MSYVKFTASVSYSFDVEGEIVLSEADYEKYRKAFDTDDFTSEECQFLLALLIKSGARPVVDESNWGYGVGSAERID